MSSRREGELQALARIVANEQLPSLARAAALLISHQRMDGGGCLCGHRALGKTHAGHVAEALAEAELLR